MNLAFYAIDGAFITLCTDGNRVLFNAINGMSHLPQKVSQT